MAYGIMGSLPDSRLLTYRTERKVGFLYFDGMSANLMSNGVESQMTFLYGDSDSVPKHPHGPPGRPPRPPNKPPGISKEDGPKGWNPLDDEYFRAQGLCKWVEEHNLGGLGWGIEAIVRMNAGFELIWCNFESPSLRLLSNINMSTPQLEDTPLGGPAMDDTQMPLTRSDTPEGPHGPGMTDPSEAFRGVANWMWFTAATRRYGSLGTLGTGPGRGEARAKVNTCGLFTFYHPSLQGQDAARVEAERSALNISADGKWKGPDNENFRDNALQQLMRRRRLHRTNNVTKDDGVHMLAMVENGLRAIIESNGSGEKTTCSGVDWQLIAEEIIIFYGDNLRTLNDLLSGFSDQSERDWLRSVRSLTHWLIMLFFEYPPKPYTESSLRDYFSMDSPAVVEAVSRCISQYDIEDNNGLNEGEQHLSWTIRETLHGICHSTIEVGLGVELQWLLHFNENEAQVTLNLEDSRRHWKAVVEELMAWLGWADLWAGCKGPCKPDERCYIPMWPTINNGMWEHGPREEEHKGRGPWGNRDQYLWEPKCVNISSFGSM
ncbi:unnamed protein product [Clonostachys rosea]|uniref:Uncharacterized protein n=1 Tax=Bionectria ochroleuca TaxID=29856 RepID=A0ABY6TXI5_BIOOC|nr:unnamed protein product [Clonostachys rosea]